MTSRFSTLLLDLWRHSSRNAEWRVCDVEGQMLDTVMRGEQADASGRRHHDFGGEALVLDKSGALYWPAQKILIVADLHLEKGSSYASRGQFLPPYDTRETLERLASVLERHDVRTLIALGDSLHDAAAHERLASDDLGRLRELQKSCDWIWVCGNHDPVIHDCFGGTVTDVLALNGLVLRHEPSATLACNEIAGHLHPSAKLRRHGTSIRRRCFIGTPRRLILPAFGAFTGGLNILDPAFEGIFTEPADVGVWMLGHDGVYQVPVRMLCAD